MPYIVKMPPTPPISDAQLRIVIEAIVTYVAEEQSHIAKREAERQVKRETSGAKKAA